MTRDPRLRLYIKIDSTGNPIAGSDVWRYHAPTTSSSRWVDITNAFGICCSGYADVIFSTSNTNGQSITAISVDGTDQGLPTALTIGKSWVLQLKPGAHTIQVTIDPNSGTAGVLNGDVSQGTATIPACSTQTANVFTISFTGNANSVSYLNLATATVCS